MPASKWDLANCHLQSALVFVCCHGNSNDHAGQLAVYVLVLINHSCELKATTSTDGHCKVTMLLKLVTVKYDNHLSPLTIEASHVVFGLSFCW